MDSRPGRFSDRPAELGTATSARPNEGANFSRDTLVGVAFLFSSGSNPAVNRVHAETPRSRL